MKMSYLQLLLIGLCFGSIVASGQSKPPPDEVNTAFTKMFPAAKNVEWREKITNFTAFFTINDKKCEAKFEKTGGWLSTEETMEWDSMPRPVLDSFKMSKYADWKKTSAYSLRTSEGTAQYHVVVTKSDMGRRILVYSLDGKLITAH